MVSILTFETPAARATSHPCPPSGAMYSGPNLDRFNGSFLGFLAALTVPPAMLDYLRTPTTLDIVQYEIETLCHDPRRCLH